MTERGWRCRDRLLPVFDRTHVMGILNVTPDSFSDGGLFTDREAAISRGIEMAREGADIIDIGGESTRPGADPVPSDEEMRRVLPVVEGLARGTDAVISIDTTKAVVAEAAIEAGAAIINDVSAMRFDARMKDIARVSGAGVVLMHMVGEPRTMQQDPRYTDVVREVRQALDEWAAAANKSGISRESIAIDPGIGFGKTAGHNLLLLKEIRELTELSNYPVVVGPSRKSFIGTTLDLPVEERLEGTAAVVAWAVANGANVVRVHDVKEMVRVTRMVEAVGGA
ncbi:MAG: dihydropteroate synthase [Actinobacteria bacterium]|nr:dihydropteroate synthase [Actinomycetota bacterium]